MMKNLKFIVLTFIAVFSFTACQEDDNFTINGNDTVSAVISLPQNQEAYILDIANPDGTAATVVWEDTNYSVPTAVSYTVQLALSGTDFANPVDAGTTEENFLVWTHAELNDVSVDNLGLVPFSAGDVDLRIKSTIGFDNVEEAFSSPVTISITPYTTSLPRLAVPGNHQGWNPDINEPGIDFVPYIASSGFGETDYEGYVWLDGGFKFVEPNDSGEFLWGNTDWEDDGTFSGIMSTDGPGNFPDQLPGYYLLRCNTAPDSGPTTYSITPIFWAITGAATPAGWPDGSEGDQGQRMTYNQTSRKWEITISLTGGEEYKFRANDQWSDSLDFGTDGNDDGSLDYGGSNFSVETSGTYFIELDLSNPRQYTQTVTLQ